MFSALIKAFTGRAGWLASLLALLIVVVTAYAAITVAPRMEQKHVVISGADSQTGISQTDLDKELVETQGEISNAENRTPAIANTAVDNIAQSEVADEQIDLATAGETETQVLLDQSDTDAAVALPDTQADLPPELSSTQEIVVQESTTVEADASAAGVHDQSSLSLRYDGLKLSLSGHLADDQLAQLIAEEVRNATPLDSEFTADVDGQGGASPLNWMGKFLAVIARLPDDAQGVINGSDMDGVQVIPDAEQTLVMQELAGSTDAENLSSQPVEVEDVIVEGGLETDNNITSGESDPLGSVSLTQNVDPEKYILSLNNRVAEKSIFEEGEANISAELEVELDQLATMMHGNPSLFLRIVGNLDFSAGPRDAEYVGLDRARQIRDYVRAQGVESFRVIAAPLPREYAYDKQIQVVFYISE